MPGIGPGMEGRADLGTLTWKYNLEIKCDFQNLTAYGEKQRGTHIEPRGHFQVPGMSVDQSWRS